LLDRRIGDFDPGIRGGGHGLSSPLGHGVGGRSRQSRRVTALPLHARRTFLAGSRRPRWWTRAPNHTVLPTVAANRDDLELKGGVHTAMYGSLCCRPGGPSALAWRSGLGPCWWSPVRMTGDREGCFRPRTSAAGERIGVERRAWRLGGRDGVERRAWRRGELAGWYGGPGSWADGAARGSRRSGKASQQARAASAAARQGSKQGQQAQRQGKPASKGRIMGASRDGHGRARTRNGQGRAWVCPDLDVASKQAGLAGGLTAAEINTDGTRR
jgi:hypothetical protein